MVRIGVRVRDSIIRGQHGTVGLELELVATDPRFVAIPTISHLFRVRPTQKVSSNSQLV